MYKKSIRSYFEIIGFLAIAFMVMSFAVSYSARMKIFYYMVCVTTPSHFFSFFTFELGLFSRRIWVRRAVVMAFIALVMITVTYLFGYLRPELHSLILYGITVLLFIGTTVFAYYVGDRIERKNLNLINRKLSEKK